jgi:outer membrane protein OmpA-like peptidoglycan-associated protein
MKIILRIIPLLFCSAAVAQNLIPDPSFEIIRRMPSRHDNGIGCTKHWSCPTNNGASDYYRKKGGMQAGVPGNTFGHQKPHSGEGYAGMCIRRNFKEYLCTKLTDTLVKDREYLVEFYISQGELSLGAVKEFGVIFSKKIQFGLNGEGITFPPAVDTVAKHGFRSKNRWRKISLVYHAHGGEGAIIIGHFAHDKKLTFKGSSHYYVDDVSVTLIKDEHEPIEQQQAEVPVNITEPATPPFSPKAGETIRLDNIFFDTNKADLLPSSFTELDQLIKYLNENPELKIRIMGHTDSSGDEEKNRKLSEQRARAVADYLGIKGIEKSRITSMGYGSMKPVTNNDTEEGRRRNRRVEFVVFGR